MYDQIADLTKEKNKATSLNKESKEMLLKNIKVIDGLEKAI